MPRKALSLQEDLLRILPEWQKRLRLQDWDIEIHIRRWHELEVQGRCTVTRQLKYADIQIRDFHDCPDPASVASYDPESVLVHELLHVLLDAANPEPDPCELIGLEQALVALGRCLVALGRILPVPAHRS